tara:strand:+ start:1787 stop:2089 length:303 start_codon:yes stop_codon:yes gene_type:complete
MYTGGLSELKLVTKNDDIINLVNNIKNQFEQLYNNKIYILKAISYKTQIVNGINYYIKVLVNEYNYVHLKIYEALPNKKILPKLINYQLNKNENDEIKYI